MWINYFISVQKHTDSERHCFTPQQLKRIRDGGSHF